jgi:hypothetical protein
MLAEPVLRYLLGAVPAERGDDMAFFNVIPFPRTPGSTWY